MSLALKRTPKTVLLVENEPLLLKFVRMILERAGFTVLSAATAEQATGIEQGSPGTIDLLITGGFLPGSSGPLLATQLAWSRPSLRVMLLSSDPAANAIAVDHGWCLTKKPFLPSALLASIAIALAPDDEPPI